MGVDTHPALGQDGSINWVQDPDIVIDLHQHVEAWFAGIVYLALGVGRTALPLDQHAKSGRGGTKGIIIGRSRRLHRYIQAGRVTHGDLLNGHYPLCVRDGG